MGKSYWKSYELKKFGLHPRTIRAFLRIQRKEIYKNKKYEELKLFVQEVIRSSSSMRERY